MGRDVDFTDGGIASFQEARANGLNAATLHAPAVLAGSYDLELFDALPGATEFVQIDATGKLFTAVGASGTLQEAYDSGGAGLGRFIVADDGEIDFSVSGSGGNLVLRVTQADDFGGVLIQKTGTGVGNPLGIADAGTGTTLSVAKTNAAGAVASISDLDGSVTINSGMVVSFQGDPAGVLQVVKINNDTDPVLVVIGAGTGPAVHVDMSGVGTDGAIVRIEADTAFDASLEFVEDSVQRFELGYDDSAGGLVIGRLSFANPVLFIEDASGQVGIGTITPDASYGVDVVGSGGTLNTMSIRASGASALHVLKLQNDSSGDPNGADIVGTGSTWQIQKTGNAIFGSAAATDSTVDIRTGAANKSRLVFGRGGNAAGQIEYDHGPDQFDITVNITQDWGSLRQAGLVLGLETGGTVDGVNTLAILNGTAPTDTPDNGVTLYAEDVAASSELKVRDEAGNVTVLSPHSEVRGHKLSEEMAWSFYSERAGKYVWVDMLRVVRLLEGLTGEELAFMGEAA